MQTTQSKILSFDASIAGGIKQANSSQNSDENGGEFLSMVLDAAKSKGENLDQKDLKEMANSVNMSAQKKSEASRTEVINVEEILGEEAAGGLFENATFMQLLQILEMLNGGEKISKFPNFSSQLARALSNESTINELRGAKNISELLDIAKKLNLGLEKITVTKEQVNELNLKFPNLAKQGFFTPVAPSQNLILKEHIKTQVEENIELKNKDKDEPKLHKLLQEISKESISDKQGQNLAPKHEKQIAPNSETSAKNAAMQENLIKENADQAAQKELIKADMTAQTQTQKVTEPKDGGKINLQSLLYPEREQTEQSGAEGGFQNSDESGLNAMVREIVQNAKAQSKNLQAVRQTFDNFNATLKEQVEAYKSPFMRFNITLNPLNLGEVEITMVNRGNNLHINFNSTTQTMNLFLQNQAEFKNSLVNMGFTELEMNFSDQNSKKEQGGRAYKGSNLGGNQNDEGAEQPLLELVLPRYI